MFSDLLKRYLSILFKNGSNTKTNLLSCTLVSPKILACYCDAKPKHRVKLENVKQHRLDEIQSEIQDPEPFQTMKEIKEKIFDMAKDKTREIITDKVVAKAAESALQKQKKKRVDPSISTVQRNFITPVRAMSDFLLKPSDLESLPKTKRRSPYECEPPITVYWRKDVEAKALDVWGSRENLIKERLLREIEKKRYYQSKE